MIEQLEIRVLLAGAHATDWWLPDGASISEGQETDLSIGVVDQWDGPAYPDTVSNVTVTWPDGTSDSAVPDEGGVGFLSKYFDDNAGTINVDVTDASDGSVVSTQFNVSDHVYNLPPAATLTTSYDDATDTLTANLVDAFDPSAADTAAGFHYSVALAGQPLAASYDTAQDNPTVQLSGDIGTEQDAVIRIFDEDNGSRDYDVKLKVPDLAVVATSSSSENLTWQDIMPDSESYRIQRSIDGENFSIYKNIGRDDLTFNGDGLITWNDDTDLSDGTKYWYRVRAVDDNNAGNDSGYSTKKDDVTPLKPPTDVMATNLNNETNDIILHWVTGSPRYDQVIVRKYAWVDGVQSSSPIATVTLPGDATEYAFINNPADTSFVFTVQGVNAVILSAESNPILSGDDPASTWVSPVGYNTARPDQAPHVGVINSPLTTGTDEDGNPYSYVGDYTGDQTFTEIVTGLTRHTWARMHGEVDFQFVGGESGDDFNPTPSVTVDGQTVRIADQYQLDGAYSGWRYFGIDVNYDGLPDAFKHTSDQMTITISMGGIPPGWRWTPEVFVDTYLPFVSISGDGTVIEDGTGKATFTVHRTGTGTVLSDPLDVTVYDSGITAVYAADEGIDYKSVGVIEIPAAATDGSKDVEPINDTLAEGREPIYQSVKVSPKYKLANIPAVPPLINETTDVAFIDDDVVVRSVTVTFTGAVDPVFTGKADPEQAHKDAFGFDFDVRIDVYGEHLDYVKVLQAVKSYSEIWDWDGNPMTRDQILGGLIGDTDPAVVDSDGEFVPDTGFSENGVPLAHFLSNIDSLHGHAYVLDNQFVDVARKMAGQSPVGKLTETSRYFRDIYFDAHNDDSLLGTCDWQYFWTNAPWQNNLDIGDPECYVSNDGGTSGAPDFSGVDYITDFPW